MNAERPGDGEGSWSGDRGKGDRAAGFEENGGVREDKSATARVLEGEGEGEMVGVSASEAELSSKREKREDEAVYVESRRSGYPYTFSYRGTTGLHVAKSLTMYSADNRQPGRQRANLSWV